jgi:hypothetical protein
MEGYEIFQYDNAAKRDAYFRNLRESSFSLPEERQAIRWSDVEPLMKSEDEFQLDDKGRVMYRSLFFVAYPIDVHGHRVRARIDRKKEQENGLDTKN